MSADLSLARSAITFMWSISLALLLVACSAGSGAGEAAPVRRTSTAPTTPTSTDHTATKTATATSGGPTDDGSGRSHPGGIFRTSPGPPVCGDAFTPGTTIAEPIVVERLNHEQVCFAEVSGSSAPMQVTLVAPDGSEHVSDAFKAHGGWLWTFTAKPNLPLGTYTFEARPPDIQDSGQPLVTTGSVEVVRATSPVVYAVEQAGPGFAMALAGFPPESLVAVFLYGPPVGAELPFVRALPPARVDGGGEGRYSWQPEPDDRPGEYGIWLNPTPAECEREPCVSLSIP